jgi:flagellar biosynthetic protein FliR
MPLSFDTVLSAMTLFAAPFLRMSAMMAVAPVFSAAGFNVRTRALYAVLIAALVAPSLPAPPVESLLSGAGVLMGIREIGVGLILGFVVQMAFGAAVFAGQAISMTMGLGFAMAVDPQNGVQVPVISQLYVIVATLLFLALDGHLLLIAAVVESYQLIPIGVAGLPAASLSAVVALGTTVFAGGILLALPALTALLLINVAFGIVTRTAPQLNIFAVGFPVTILAGLFIMFLVMPGFIEALTQLIGSSLQRGLGVFG